MNHAPDGQLWTCSCCLDKRHPSTPLFRAQRVAHLYIDADRPACRLNPPDTPEADLKKRTLTNLYNARPTGLADAHRTLDEAVFAAYNWPSQVDGQALTTPEILARLLALNHQRAIATSVPSTEVSTEAEPTCALTRLHAFFSSSLHQSSPRHRDQCDAERAFFNSEVT